MSPARTQATAARSSTLRWIAVSVFMLSTSLNYLDRQLVAALAPTLESEFHLSNASYGGVISAFSIVYAVMAPLAGWIIDRAGLNIAATLSMAVWSLAGMATGITRTFTGLLGARVMLGVGEAAGIPSTGKVNGLYLESRELALGTALNQVSITLGMVAAPLMVAWLAPQYGWRSVFVVCGALGFVWIPLWWTTSRRIPPRSPSKSKSVFTVSNILHDRRVWGLALANALVMTPYTLWSNWTTIFFVDRFGMSESLANRQFAWVGSVFATLGGFAGGWMAYRAIMQKKTILSARLHVSTIAAVALLLTAAAPFMPSPALSTVLVSFSFFWCLAISTNLYAMPIDFFGAEHAAFGVSILTGSYALMQTVVSPLIGAMVDRLGFAGVCIAIAALPLLGVGILKWTSKRPAI